MNPTSNWHIVRLEDVVEIHDSKRIPLNRDERALRPGPYPYYGATGQVDSLDDYLFDGEYILLAEDGGPFDDLSRDVAYMATGKFWVNNHAHVLKPKDNIPTKFLVSLLNSINWLPHVSGTTRYKLTQGALRQVELLMPPLETQRQIAAKLDLLSSHTKRANDYLSTIPTLTERFRQSVLARAFTGELTADWRKNHPDVEPASELLARIKVERRQKWIDTYARNLADRARKSAEKKGKPFSDADWQAYYDKKLKAGEKKYEEPQPVDAEKEGLPEIPESWEWVSLDQIGELVTGSTPDKSNNTYYGDYLPFVKPTELNKGYVDKYTREKLSKNGAKEARILPPESIMVTCIGATIGKTALSLCECATNQQINSIIPFTHSIIPKWLYHAVCSTYIQTQILQNASATTLPILNKSRFGEILVALPSLVEQYEIARRVSDLFDVLTSFEAQADNAAQQLDRLKSSTLSAMLSVDP